MVVSENTVLLCVMLTLLANSSIKTSLASENSAGKGTLQVLSSAKLFFNFIRSIILPPTSFKPYYSSKQALTMLNA